MVSVNPPMATIAKTIKHQTNLIETDSCGEILSPAVLKGKVSPITTQCFCLSVCLSVGRCVSLSSSFLTALPI